MAFCKIQPIRQPHKYKINEAIDCKWNRCKKILKYKKLIKKIKV